MSINDAIIGLKEFLWDIIGFLLPGFIFLLFSNVFLKYSLDEKDSFPIQDMYILGILFLSYGIGHILHGINSILDKNIFKTRKHLFSKIEQSETYLIALQLMEIEFKSKNTTFNTAKIGYNEVRNFAMSKFPDLDHKVYTFRFRGIIATHLITIFLLYGIAGITSVLTNFYWQIEFFKTDLIYFILYVLMLLSIIPLYQTKVDFESIAFRLPVSHFVSKQN